MYIHELWPNTNENILFLVHTFQIHYLITNRILSIELFKVAYIQYIPDVLLNLKQRNQFYLGLVDRNLPKVFEEFHILFINCYIDKLF